MRLRCCIREDRRELRRVPVQVGVRSRPGCELRDAVVDAWWASATLSKVTGSADPAVGWLSRRRPVLVDGTRVGVRCATPRRARGETDLRGTRVGADGAARCASPRCGESTRLASAWRASDANPRHRVAPFVSSARNHDVTWGLRDATHGGHTMSAERATVRARVTDEPKVKGGCIVPSSVCVGASLVLGLAVGAAASYDRALTKEIQTTRLVMLSPDGSVGYTLGVTGTARAPVLQVRDANDRPCVGISSSENSTSVSILDGEGKVRHLFRVDQGGSPVTEYVQFDKSEGLTSIGITAKDGVTGGFVLVRENGGAYLETLPRALAGK